MVDREESRLKGMNLTKLTDNDRFLSQDDDWGPRSTLHGHLKGSSLMKNKPIGDYFEFEENSIDKDYIHILVYYVPTCTTVLHCQFNFINNLHELMVVCFVQLMSIDCKCIFGLKFIVKKKRNPMCQWLHSTQGYVEYHILIIFMVIQSGNLLVFVIIIQVRI